MKKKERFDSVISFFEKNHAEVETELHYENPFQLLVAVVLSAQCTDKRVNMVTPALFEKYPDPVALADSTQEEIFSFIRSISYPNNKAKHLLALGKRLVSEFQSEVPSDVEKLQTLEGVGRKTANVIASVIFNQPTMAVDTHVFRVSKRVGLVHLNSKTPLSVELQLYKYLPKEIIPRAHHWLILHGRYVCLARKPKCSTCGIQDACLYYSKLVKKASV